jgi:hypothetical protein
MNEKARYDATGKIIQYQVSALGQHVCVYTVDHCVAGAYVSAWCRCQDCDGRGETYHERLSSHWSAGYDEYCADCETCGGGGEVLREWGSDGEDVSSLYRDLLVAGAINGDEHARAVCAALEDQ